MVCAFSLPYEISYCRVKKLEAGDAVGWGTENRGAPVRKIKQGHWEIRFVDATSNIYLTVAALLSAGLLGIQGQEPLLWNGCSFEQSTCSSDHDGGTLPSSLERSLELIHDNAHVFGNFISSRLIARYVAVKNHEASNLKALGDTRTREILEKLFWWRPRGYGDNLSTLTWFLEMRCHSSWD